MAGSKWQDQVSSNGLPVDGVEMEGGPSERETGIVEKLLSTYGFIRCCDRHARLFFHYSQYNGNVEHLKAGDHVDFEMTYDKKSGKPIAVKVAKIVNDPNHGVGQQMVTGIVTAELNGDGREGRVAHENCGECFFLEFGLDDQVDRDQRLTLRQPVQFCITADETGALQVSQLRGLVLSPSGSQSQFNNFPSGNALPSSVSMSLAAHSNGIAPLAPMAMAGMYTTSMVAPTPAAPQPQAMNGHCPPAGRTLISSNPGLKVEWSKDHMEHEEQQHFSGQSTTLTNNSTSSPQKGGKKVVKVRGAEEDEQGMNQNNQMRNKYQGVVCSLKDSFGFVERADVVKEIFFHCTECPNFEEIQLGDDVCFDINSRNGREVAVNIERLPCGTVVFEDISASLLRGVVMVTANTTDQPLDGKISFVDSLATTREAAFGDRDLSPAPYTLRTGDPVEFQLATDRRDGLERATNIMVCVNDPNAFANEERLQGSVVALKENYGFISVEQGTEYYFKLHEVLDTQPLRIDSVVQFTLGTENHSNNGGGRQVATRITRVQGQAKKKSRKQRFTNKGFIVALKEHYGFIEADNRLEDVFFHYSAVDGDTGELELGSEVEYGLTVKAGKRSAECVRTINQGTIPAMQLLSQQVNSGRVERTLRCFSNDQQEYVGLVSKSQLEAGAGNQEELDSNANEKAEQFEFSVMSLAKKGDVVQTGDVVEFQLAVCPVSEKVMAVNVRAIREKKQATVEAIKGSFGFLNYEVELGKKLFFHTSEVNGTELHAGDRVEFQVGRTGRNNKFSAMNLRKVKGAEGASPRPPALVNRIKALALDDGPRVVTIRQPRGPDGSKGFTTATLPSMSALSALA